MPSPEQCEACDAEMRNPGFKVRPSQHRCRRWHHGTVRCKHDHGKEGRCTYCEGCGWWTGPSHWTLECFGWGPTSRTLEQAMVDFDNG